MGQLDLCEAEQSALAREFVLTSKLYVDEPWSHAGPKSISPFAPCAETRLPHIFDAARISPDSVLWDLGCGDGRVLHEAAVGLLHSHPGVRLVTWMCVLGYHTLYRVITPGMSGWLRGPTSCMCST
jgi:hypothetical protein